MQDTSRKFSQVCEILDKNGRDKAKLVPILQQVQDFYRYLPEEVLAFIATSLDLPPAHVYGVATFYAHFALEPKGKHIIRVCDGTACHVRGSKPILAALYQRLKVTPEKPTSADMLFTVEAVSCLGACGLAPVLLINEDVHGKVTPESTVELVEKILAEEAKSEAA